MAARNEEEKCFVLSFMFDLNIQEQLLFGTFVKPENKCENLSSETSSGTKVNESEHISVSKTTRNISDVC